MAGFDDVEERMRVGREADGPKVDAAAAVRALIDDLVTADLTGEQAALIASTVASLRAGFEGVARRASWAAVVPDPQAGSAGFFLTSPMMGKVNAIAPPLTLWVEGERVLGEAVFGATYEGPPGCVHGGITAAVFDELLGTTQSAGERPGMTGRLTISYRSPTPLFVPVRFVGWIDRVEGRKIFTVGYSEVDGADGPRRCADAEGLFIAVDFGNLHSAWSAGAS